MIAAGAMLATHLVENITALYTTALCDVILGIPFVPAAIGLPGEPGPAAFVGRSRLKCVDSHVESVWFLRLELNYDESAFKRCFQSQLAPLRCGLQRPHLLLTGGVVYLRTVIFKP